MNAISALSSISVSNAVAALTSPVPASRAQSARTASEPSVTTSFSDLALTLLKQQASDPSQDIDDAFATNLLNRSLGNSAPLYTASGVLQQFASATSVLALAENQGASNQVFGNLNGSGIDANRALTDLIDSLRQPAVPQAATSAAIDPILVPADLAAAPLDQLPPSFDTSRLIATTTAASRRTNRTENEPSKVDVTAASANATTPPQINADEVEQPVDNAEQVALDAQLAQNLASPQSGSTDAAAVLDQPDFAFFNNDDQVPFGMDAYQMAALASGFSAFGKELNTFVPASGDNITQGAVGQVTAIAPVMRIVARTDEAAEA